MNNKRIAVMDLGTNTFHLLIAEGPADNFTEILHLNEDVKLGKGGINKGIIQPEAFERGIAAMKRFRSYIDVNSVTDIRAIATSAIRSAANGQDFIRKVKEQAHIDIELITGEQEAAYIYEGINASGCLTDDNALIMDIGGGSVEFIIGNTDEVLWKQSFEIGAARLMDKFHQTDPVPVQAIKELTQYLNSKLPELFLAASKYKPAILIGSSGAFESFAEVIELEKGKNFNLKQTKVYNFDIDELLDLIERLIKSSHSQRAKIKGIIPVRVDMIVVASLITIYMMQKMGIADVTMSTYSLKEGVLAQMLS
ncbi:exopolyphosphatase [Mucilaginibacter sp. RB4R14]|uniref:Ppx/GppA phosphatase family protein n=1 Tax=Mucilaginibacter aurantiaciroseus TaxID=2949308 RepID=UPI0020907485|nr:exopolyphosphatase [Mucilaginibacter aurantiaciroseus]MCO5934473.1 exopolyphosphatase [Mucilaginibacter aurantiaciroseus]